MKIKPEYLIYIIHCLIEIKLCYLNEKKGAKLISNNSRVNSSTKVLANSKLTKNILESNSSINNTDHYKDLDNFKFDDVLRSDDNEMKDVMRSLDEDFDQHFNPNASNKSRTVDNKLNTVVFKEQAINLKLEYTMSDGNREKEADVLTKIVNQIAGSDDITDETVQYYGKALPHYLQIR